MTTIQYLDKLPFNQKISFSDIPKNLFNDWYLFYEMKEVNYHSYKFKLIDSKDNKGFIKISLKKHQYIGKKVIQMDKNCLELQEYESISIAAEKTVSRPENICKCCRGVQKIHNGFKWKYALK